MVMFLDLCCTGMPEEERDDGDGGDGGDEGGGAEEDEDGDGNEDGEEVEVDQEDADETWGLHFSLSLYEIPDAISGDSFGYLKKSLLTCYHVSL